MTRLALLAVLLTFSGCSLRTCSPIDSPTYGYWPPDDWLPYDCPKWERKVAAYDEVARTRPLRGYELKERRQMNAQYQERCK